VSRFRIALLVLSAVVAVALAAAWWTLDRSTGGPTSVRAPGFEPVARSENRPAPGFHMPAVNGGRSIDLRDFRGRIVVLNFWASWCGPCRQEAPQLQRAWETYRDRGVQFLGADERDDSKDALAFQHEFAITYPSISDPRGELEDAYRVVGIPSTVLISKDGRIVYRFLGKVDEGILGHALESLLAGRSI